MTVLLEYIVFLAEHIQYSSSFSHNHQIHALNNCYQVGQYLKHHAQKRPKILKLCLRVSYNSGIIFSKMFTYYSQNYAGIIGTGLTMTVHFMVLGHVNRTAWGTKLLLTAVLASLVDCISSCHDHLLKAQHCSFESELVLYPAFGSPPSIDSILQELKKLSQNQQHLNS